MRIDFKQWFNETVYIINWNKSIHADWIDKSTGKTHTYRLENRKLGSLHPHEIPTKYRIAKMIKLVKSGAAIPIISIGVDGMILDGHARYYAIKKLFGNDFEIPVEIQELK